MHPLSQIHLTSWVVPTGRTVVRFHGAREFLLSRLVVEWRRKMAHVAVCSERTRMAVARREVAEVAVPAAKGRGGIYGSGK